MDTKFVWFLLQGIPEMTGTFALVLAILRVPIRWLLVIPTATIICIAIYLIRTAGASFGVHTAFLILSMVVLLCKATRSKLSSVFIASFVTEAIVATVESLNNIIFSHFLDLNISTLPDTNWVLWKMIGFPQNVVIILLAILYAKFKRPREGMWRV
ncbi:hypothetical protein Psch_02924 [Pelotomaculum schinkii]|uniref:Uncharacterized protein n=1 Tax=Pelotomaculum schinkii TaxID=78350 RepID=A0A4Y7RAQ0_9FIRM|nr:hypothetical protein [Pelotomaculum schinkii]TEB05882.1 hypothetical protein Psch_02924 [Pelotomaculum schinkii]